MLENKGQMQDGRRLITYLESASLKTGEKSTVFFFFNVLVSELVML